MYTRKKCRWHFGISLICLLFASCSNIGFELPQGPQGASGKSAYEIWKEEVEAGRVNWPSDKTDVADFLVYIKGEKGDKGADGMSAYEQWKTLIATGTVANPHEPSQLWPPSRNTEADFWDFISGRDGQAPHVGENGNWWIGSTDTGVKAAGKDGKDGLNGKDGLSAYEQWQLLVAQGELDWPKDQLSQNDFYLFLKGQDGSNGVTPHVGTNGNWYIGATDTGIPARGEKGDKGDKGEKGEDGLSPFVGNNGNWWVGQTDTKIPARGKDGSDGITPIIVDGYWWIGNINTGIMAQGPKGDKGNDGANGKTPVIKDGYWWIDDVNTGIKATGENGRNGENGMSPYIGDNGNWWLGKDDTGIPAQGKDGKNGTSGASAYELWVQDVKDGKIRDKEGKIWPAEKITLNDFYTYLSGSNGSDGKSAYELWKETVTAGKVDDPNHPGEKWPADKVSENDFFSYLTGKDGKDGRQGINGLSAYELWKEDLARRCNTVDALIDHKEGGMWDCNKNTLNDFYNYLRGKDGKDGEDGKDGKPGEPGLPGAEVTIIKGIPNVIAQYSQSEFGEYVRTTDGGVLYKVYDEQGQIAPRAIVKGMPGISPEKSYTANEKGEFIVPKEDLPQIQDINLRWGTVQSVALEGKASQVSAKNTYVPNRVRMRIILRSSPSLDSQQNLYYYIQRKMNPDDAWQNLPSYLPEGGSMSMEAYRVSDKNNPKSILTDQKLVASPSSGTSNNERYYSTYVNRPVKENPAGIKNGYSQYWDGTDIYFTLKGSKPYYGEEYQWNGVCLLAPYQMGPTLKKIKLKSLNNGEAPAFASAEGELDFSLIDFTKIYKSSCKQEVKENGMDYVEPIAYTEEEARKLPTTYVRFLFTSTAGNQEASSSNNKASANAPTFKVFTPFLNSSIYIERSASNYFYGFTQGYLQKGTAPNTFIVKNYSSNYQFKEVEVTYEE